MHLLKSYEFFEKSLNVSTLLVALPPRALDEELMIRNQLSIFLGKVMYFPAKNVINTYFIEPVKFVLLVPVIQESEIELPINILYSFLLLSGIIIFFRICAHFFKFKKEEWSVFNIYCLMLDMGVKMDPRRNLKSIIIFFTLFAVSFFFVSDLVSDLTSLKYSVKKQPIVESYDDIFKKNITVVFYHRKSLLEFFQEATLGIIQKVAYKAKVIETKEDSYYDYKKVFILQSDFAEKLLYKNQNTLNGIKHEISELFFYDSFYVMSFLYNNPLKHKFDKVYQRILEAGLNLKWRSDYERANKIGVKLSEDILDDDGDYTLPFILITVMLIGTILGLLLLIFECVWYHYVYKKYPRANLKKNIKQNKRMPLENAYHIKRIIVQPIITQIIYV